MRGYEGYSNSRVMRTERAIDLTGEIQSIWWCIECNEAGPDTNNRRKLECLGLVTSCVISKGSLKKEGRETSWITGCGSRM